MENYELLVDVHIFDTDVILDALTRLISAVEGKRYYLRQKDIYAYTSRVKERTIYDKKIQWQNKCGKVLSKYDLGKYDVYWSGDSFHEQIMFVSILRKSIADDAWTIFQTQQIVAERFKKAEAMVSCECEFEQQPYIQEFIQFLINYRAEHQLLEITEEQMDEALGLYLVQYKEQHKQKVLQPNKPQD